MPAHARDPGDEPSPHPRSIFSSTSALATYIERQVSEMETEGLTMSGVARQAGTDPGSSTGLATEMVRELRDADDPRDLG